MKMTNKLTTNYLGLSLSSPFVVSACPLTGNLTSLKALREHGAAAVVLPSIFEEQIEHDELEVARLLDFWALSSPESNGYFPDLQNYNTGPSDYLDLIADAKRELDIPIIASLNGFSPGGWMRYAGLIEQAGADALEINVCAIHDNPDLSAGEADRQLVSIVSSLRQGIKLPIAVKLGPYYSALAHLAKELTAAGANGLVLFNRYLAPDIDLDSLEYVPALELSTPAELRTALRWIAILRDQVDISLAATGGVHSVDDVVKALLAGADVVACASVLLSKGPTYLQELVDGLTHWLTAQEYVSVGQLLGSMSQSKCPNPDSLKRANYMRALTSYI